MSQVDGMFTAKINQTQVWTDSNSNSKLAILAKSALFFTLQLSRVVSCNQPSLSEVGTAHPSMLWPSDFISVNLWIRNICVKLKCIQMKTKQGQTSNISTAVGGNFVTG